jgi:hypothetical protein
VSRDRSWKFQKKVDRTYEYVRKGPNGYEMLIFGPPTPNNQLQADYEMPLGHKSAVRFKKKYGTRYTGMNQLSYRVK